MTAHAGKRERDLVTKELTPAVKNAEVKFKEACGCTLSITVDNSTIDKLDDIRIARYVAKDIAEEAPKYCTDDASKKAMCQMKSVTIAKAKKAEFTINGGKAMWTHDGQGRTTWGMMTRVLDK